MEGTIAVKLTQRQWDLVILALEEHANNCNSSPAANHAIWVQDKIKSQLEAGGK